MATISSSIQMMDRLTAPVLKMASAMSSLVTTMEAADNKKIDPKGLGTMKDSIAKANAELQNLQSELAGAGAQTQQNTAKQQQWNSSIHGGGKAVNGLINKLKAAVGMYALINGAKKLAGISDEVMTIDARLNLITDTSAQKNNLKNAAYQMAQEARVPLNSFTNDVAKLGILAGKRFSNNAEIIQFMGNATKAFKVAGTSATETAGAMTQLNQALASGVLQGDEFRSIRENAPLITQAIAKEMGVSQDHLKKLASEGKITADVVRRAVLGMTDDINRDFSKLPMTWGEVWVKAGNFALRVFDPLLRMINQVANSQKFKSMATSMAGTFEMVAGVMTIVFDKALELAGWVYEKWDLISPVVIGVAVAMGVYALAQGIATLAIWAYNTAAWLKVAADTALQMAAVLATIAQQGLNAAIYAFPGTWIVVAIAAVIAVVIGLVVGMIYLIKTMTKTATVTGVVVGAFDWMKAMLWNIWASIVNAIISAINGIIRGINGLIRSAAKGLSNFANIFIDAFNWIMREADKFINGLLKTMSGAAPLLSAIGINLPTSTGGAMQLARANFSAPQIAEINYKLDKKEAGAAYRKGAERGNAKQKKWENDLKNGYKNAKDMVKNELGDLGGGKGLDPAGTGMPGGGGGGGKDPNGVGKNTGKTADNTGKMANSLEDTEEDLKYLRELAEQEHINQFTTAEIKVEMNNNNTIENEADIDKVINKLTEKIEEKMNIVAEGVH